MITDILNDKDIRILDAFFRYYQKEIGTSGIDFNIFEFIPGNYHSETLHSDIIGKFLNPKCAHGEGNLFLNLFIEMIGLDKDDYRDAIVKREVDDIDILIYNVEKGKAVVIENKMHDATDMANQLPRYYHSVNKKGLKVEKIIYIPLNENKVPDESTWKIEDKAIIKELLMIIPAYKLGNELNLVDNWIIPCAKAAKKEKCRFILNDYAALIKHEYHPFPSISFMKSIYDKICNQDEKDLKPLLEKITKYLPKFMNERILNHYKNNFEPFDKFGKGLLDYSRFIFSFKNKIIEFGILPSINDYRVYFHGIGISAEELKKTLKEIPRIAEFHKGTSIMDLCNELPVNEAALFEYIDGWKEIFRNSHHLDNFPQATSLQ